MIRIAAIVVSLAFIAEPVAAQTRFPAAAQAALSEPEPAALADGIYGELLCVIILSDSMRFFEAHDDIAAADDLVPDLERFVAALDARVAAGEATVEELQTEAALQHSYRDAEYWYLSDIPMCSSSGRWPGFR